MPHKLSAWNADTERVVFDPPRPPSPKKTKRVLVVRYGGIGDMIQAGTVMHYYKQHHWHVSVNCHPIGAEILANDNNVDDILVQQPGQVPNLELGKYWGVLKRPYDKFINLTESVESYLLVNDNATPSHWWPQAARHRLLNINYLEMAHLIADIPPGTPFEARFRASPRDYYDATAYRKKLLKKGRPPIVMWTLSGSSVHKAWPYLDQVCARILLAWPKCRIIFTGDQLSQILETGWEKEPRVLKKCGRLKIRPTLALAKYGVDLVIGPETGVMNAVGLEKVGKIVTLSHSSEENLTKHWQNTIALKPTQSSCPCYPCHILHHSFDSCHQDPATGAALCQAMISADTMWSAIMAFAAHLGWERPHVNEAAKDGDKPVRQLQRISQ